MSADWGTRPGPAALQRCLISLGAAPSAPSCFIHVPVASAASSAGASSSSSQRHKKKRNIPLIKAEPM